MCGAGWSESLHFSHAEQLSQAVKQRIRLRLPPQLEFDVVYPRSLAIPAWLWLAAEADDLEERRCCLSAFFQQEPEDETASLALSALDRRRPTN